MSLKKDHGRQFSGARVQPLFSASKGSWRLVKRSAQPFDPNAHRTIRHLEVWRK